jgi:hypothetical protein
MDLFRYGVRFGTQGQTLLIFSNITKSESRFRREVFLYPTHGYYNKYIILQPKLITSILLIKHSAFLIEGVVTIFCNSIKVERAKSQIFSILANQRAVFYSVRFQSFTVYRKEEFVLNHD